MRVRLVGVALLAVACGPRPAPDTPTPVAEVEPATDEDDDAAAEPVDDFETETMSTDGLYQCSRPRGDLTLTMRADFTARDLAVAFIGVTCANVIIPQELAERVHKGAFSGRLKPVEIEPRFRALFEEMGLALVRKDGAAIIVDQAWLARRPGMVLLRRVDPALEITTRPPPSIEPPPVVGDDTHRVVTRTDVSAAIAAGATGARVLPSVKNGQPNGAKLYAIRPSSVYARAGLQNGDTVHTINGVDVQAPDQLLIDKLFAVDHLELSITRRGKPVTLVIDVE